MEIKIEEKILDTTYQKAKNLNNFTFYHTKNWHETLNKTFGWKIKAATCYNGSNLVYFLPFIEKMRLNLSHVKISLPLSHKIGPAYELKAAKKIEADNKMFEKLTNIEVHDKINSASLNKFSTDTIITLDLEMFKNLDDLFHDLDKSSIQRKIKKAEKENIKVKKTNNLESFKTFSNLENITRYKQGSPAYPQNFFSNLYESFKGTPYLNLYSAQFNDEIVSGVIFSQFNNEAIYLYGASLDNRDLYRLGINQITMWEAVKDSYFKGLKRVDFGKTPNSLESLEKYKLKWGGTSKPLTYSYSKTIKNSGINRGGLPARTASFALKKMPYKLFTITSPYLLKLAL